VGHFVSSQAKIHVSSHCQGHDLSARHGQQ